MYTRIDEDEQYGKVRYELCMVYDRLSFPKVELPEVHLMGQKVEGRVFEVYDAYTDFIKNDSYVIESLPKDHERYQSVWWVFLPFFDVNEDWKAEGTNYLRQVEEIMDKIPKNIKLPIGFKREKLEKFLLKYPELRPIKQFETKEEIIEYYINDNTISH